MPNPSKKLRLVGPANKTATSVPLRRSRRIAGRPNATIAEADVVVEAIFGFLSPKDIMRSRRVCKRWKEAAKKAAVPIDNDDLLEVKSMETYNAIVAMSTAMPNLPQIVINPIRTAVRFNEGDDPCEILAANTASDTRILDFQETITRFRKLRILYLYKAPLNGRYPFLFNFRFLEKLYITSCTHLKWDLAMLAGMPLLKQIDIDWCKEAVTGNIKSLRVLKETLEAVSISDCANVSGNFMEFADFPRLIRLNLTDTAVTGNILDIKEQDFPAFAGRLSLPRAVFGGSNYEFQRIADVSEFMSAFDRVRKNRHWRMFHLHTWKLANDSPDRYSTDHLDVIHYPPPPFSIQFIKAGPRWGWQWKHGNDRCEVNWLDPEPDRDSSDYESYTRCLRKYINPSIKFYKGFHLPPTQDEYEQLCDRYRERQM